MAQFELRDCACHHGQNAEFDELFELEFELEFEELFELELELELEELLELEFEELLPAKSSGSGPAAFSRPGNCATGFGVTAMLLMPPISVIDGAAACVAPVAPVSDATAIATAEAILCPFFMS